MHPVLLSVGPLKVYSWGFMVAIGVLLALFMMIRYAKQEGVRTELIVDLFIYMVISSALGARVFYVIGNFNNYKGNIASIFNLQEGGMVFLGGFFLAMLTIIFYSYLKKMDIWKVMDILSPGTMLGYAVGRIGCLLNGCCYGIKLCGVVQPTQIYSSIVGALIFIALMSIYKNKKFDGQVFLSATIMYSIYRFLIEFIRHSPGHYFGLTANQFLSIALLIFSLSIWKKNSIS